MCNCNSEWVQNANMFLQQNNNNQDAKYHVVQYLLNNNKCGKNNGVYLKELLDYVNQNNPNNIYKRENFQHNVLIPLKKKNILVSLPYPGRRGGIFIPCDINEVKKAYKQVLNRVHSELCNISYVANSSSITTNLNNIIKSIKLEIDNL